MVARRSRSARLPKRLIVVWKGSGLPLASSAMASPSSTSERAGSDRTSDTAELGEHPVEHALRLAVGVGVLVDLEPDLGPVEPGDDDSASRISSRSTISARTGRRGRGGQREDRGVAELLDDAAEPQVVGSEVVAPRRDAVRLVDHEQRRAGLPDGVDDLGLGQLLGGEEDEADRSVTEPPRAPPAGRPADMLEFSCAGRPARSSISASRSTWSRCRAISGETTTTGPSSSWPATW